MAQDLKNAKTVLDTEIQGLTALKEILNNGFVKAVEAIASMKAAEHPGRLIVAGIGKSGHVARKIAATMASTGTPAYFVHPGEASHGDLGMVKNDDIVLMLSNSGENQELSDLIHYTRRYGITMIAMTSKPQSTLATHSDIILQLPRDPEAPEACPNGLAPTTSTTMMMALGDALAVALLKRMNLSAEDFRAFHPGGKLGQQLQSVTDVMIPFSHMAVLSAEATMQDVILQLTEKNLGAAVIANSPSDVLGIITDGDLKRHMGPDLMSQPASAIMSKDPKQIEDHKLAAEALNIMTKQPSQYITSLLAFNESGELTGLLRLQDCLQAGVS